MSNTLPFNDEINCMLYNHKYTTFVSITLSEGNGGRCGFTASKFITYLVVFKKVGTRRVSKRIILMYQTCQAH
jgi:hypothetical protein